MEEAKWDKEGNLTNAHELSQEQVVAAYHDQNRKLHGRATEAETKAKEAEEAKATAEKEREEAKKAEAPEKPEPPAEPEQPAQPEESQTPKDQADPDELRLIAKGLSNEQIAEAKAIAKGKDVSLLEALETDTYKAWDAHRAEEAKKEKAKLDGAGGSGDGEKEQSDFQPGMASKDHKEAWRRRMGRS